MAVERPILMSAPMVRALLAGTKTQTRRVVVPGPTQRWLKPSTLHDSPRAKPVLIDGQQWAQFAHPMAGKVHMGIPHDEWSPLGCVRCPYGRPGDRLWVRETFAKIDGQTQPWIETDYRATYTHGDRLGDTLGIKKRWTPSIHMPRAASRITLEVTGVRVERLRDISEADAIAEGIEERQVSESDSRWVNYLRPHECKANATCGDPRESYRTLWESINGPGSWTANPWVWVLSFKVVDRL